MFGLLTLLFKEQIGVNYLVASKLAYYSARAAITFSHSGNVQQTETFLIKFYVLVDKHSIEDVDATKSAKAELNYWLVHRYPKRYAQSLPEAVCKAKSTLFSVQSSSLEQFGLHYVAGTNIRDKATHIDHVEPDWEAIQKHFELAYASLHESVNKI